MFFGPIYEDCSLKTGGGNLSQAWLPSLGRRKDCLYAERWEVVGWAALKGRGRSFYNRFTLIGTFPTSIRDVLKVGKSRALPKETPV